MPNALKRTISLVLLSLLAILVFNGCRSKGPEQVRPRVVIIGVDGAGWNFMNPLLEEGYLKNFRRLIKIGSSGILETIQPTKSSVIWTSIATGKSMVKHGIVDWTFIEKNDIEVPYGQSERRVKAFWNILSELGLKVGVINWFVTFPPEEVNGFMVSPGFHNPGRRNVSGPPVTYPPELIKDLSFAQVVDYEKIRKKEAIPDFREGSPGGRLSSNFPDFLLKDKAVELASLHLFRNFPVDVFATYFHLVDVVSHFAVAEIDPALRKKARAEAEKGEISQITRDEVDRAYSHILEPIYSYMDRIIGRFLDLADDKTTFIILSDHTFWLRKEAYGHYNMPVIPHGILIIKGPAFKSNYKIQNAHVYDILPTLLHLLGYAVAEDMDGKVLLESFKDGSLASSSVKSIKTYEGGLGRKTAPRNKEIDKKLLEELRALGYIK